MSQRVSVFLVGLLVLVQAFLIFVPMVILGGAIEWPASLDFPPGQVLPLIAANLQGVRLGYGVYLFYSVMWTSWEPRSPGWRCVALERSTLH